MASGLEVLGGILNVLEILEELPLCLKPCCELDRISAESGMKGRRIETSVQKFEPLFVLGGGQSRILSSAVQEFENIRDELSEIECSRGVSTLVELMEHFCATSTLIHLEQCCTSQFSNPKNRNTVMLWVPNNNQRRVSKPCVLCQRVL